MATLKLTATMRVTISAMSPASGKLPGVNRV